jgi:hypothetical protein
MFEKFFLIVIATMVGFVIFSMNKMQKNISSKEVFESPKPEVVQNVINMPKIWQELEKRGATKVFLSYDTQDYKTAKEISALLEQDGLLLSVYMPDIENKNLNSNTEILDAISSADVFLILSTEGYAKNALTNQEYGIAFSKKKNIIAISPFEKLPEILNYTENFIQISDENQSKLQSVFFDFMEGQKRQKIDELDLKI